MSKLLSFNRPMFAVFAAGFFTVVHYASVVYINSSVLEKYSWAGSAGLLYALGSLISILFLLAAPLLVKTLGSKKAFLCFIFLEIIATLSLGFSEAALAVAVFFVLHHSGESMLNFFMDINAEQETKRESETGRTRGTLLTVQNVAWVLSPLLIPLLQNQERLTNVYIASSLVLLPLAFIVIFIFKNISTSQRETASTHLLKIKELFKSRDTFRIVIINFVLNFFYSWMVIYLPLFLGKELGLGWEEIGILFTIMLTPFLLFELPVGILNDKVMGEKELLIFGLIITAMATSLLPIFATKGFIILAIILFLTRTGASIVEISGESYFFKKVKEKDTSMISVFRMVRPVSFLLAPLIAWPFISMGGYGASFYALGAFVLLGLLFIPKVDTR